MSDGRISAAGMEAWSEGELARVARGEGGQGRGAFEELVRRMGRAVYLEILLQVRDSHLAEDLTQEVFIKAWRGIGGLSEPEKVRGWVGAIGRGVVGDWVKSGRRGKRGGGRGTVVLGEVEGREGLDVGEREEGERALARLAELPERHRVALGLRFLEGAEYSEICRAMGVSGGALRGLLSRGLVMLREAMGAGGGDRTVEKKVKR